jgi:hypothetical protein
MQGYLNKYKPVSQLMGLFSQEWELRYFVLSGCILRYYKSERDAAFTAGYRGLIDVQVGLNSWLSWHLAVIVSYQVLATNQN